METKQRAGELVINDFVSRIAAKPSAAFNLLEDLFTAILMGQADLEDHLAIAELVITVMPDTMVSLIKLAEELSLDIEPAETSESQTCVHQRIGTAVYLHLFETCLAFLSSLEECQLSISVRAK